MIARDELRIGFARSGQEPAGWTEKNPMMVKQDGLAQFGLVAQMTGKRIGEIKLLPAEALRSIMSTGQDSGPKKPMHGRKLGLQ